MDKLILKEHIEAQIGQIDRLAKSEKYVDAYTLSTLVIEAIGFYKRYWDIDFSSLFPRLLAVQPEYQLVLLFSAEYLSQQGRHDSASDLARLSTSFDESGKCFNIKYVRTLRAAGRVEQARAECLSLLEFHPDDYNLMAELALCETYHRFSGKDYYSVLHAVHREYKPGSYLEIGVAQGRSLALAGNETIAIGVDPDTAEPGKIMYLSPENRPVLFRTTSDDFFDRADLPDLIGADRLDMAFLDGLHRFEQTLRDFINVERFAGPDTLIFIHDGLPLNKLVADPDRKTAFWVGDVWKIIPCLKAVRPDLDIVTFPLQPSGLTLVRKLDPKSRILQRQFETITEHFKDLQLPEDWDERCKLLNVTDELPEHLLGLGELR